MKRCLKCQADKADSEFYTHKRTGKPNGPCKECAKKAAADRRRRIADMLPELQRGYELKRRYGITGEDYERILDIQGGVCAICEGPPGPRAKYFHVDHCHDSGAVRGLLCRDCNQGLGSFRDRIDIVRAAIAYLKESA